jgi:hypothetical protein
MPVITHTLQIAATPRAIFRALVGDLPRLSSWWAALAQHEIIARTPRFVGSRLRYAYLLHGIRIKGEYEVVDFAPPRYVFIRTLSGIHAVLELVLEDDGTTTTLDLTANYALPGTLLGSSTHRPALESQIEDDLITMIQQLKATVETHQTPTEKDSQQS